MINFISKNNIFLKNNSLSKKELFHFIAKTCKDLGISDDIEVVEKGLFDREKEGCTIIDTLTAIPHTRVDNIKKLQVILIMLEKPIDYYLGKKVDLVYSILAPKKSNDEFIDILTSVANLIQDAELANLIRNSDIGMEVNIINKIEYILKNNI